MKMLLKATLGLLCWASLLFTPGIGLARDPGPGPEPITPFQLHAINITNLQNTITNIGSFGSVTKPFPSCEWPAGSDNLYLYDAELWVGGVIDDQIAVTTGRLSGTEWMPLEEISITPQEVAFSDEDTYTRYDDISGGRIRSGDHIPLGIQVSQRTMAWTGDDFIVHDMIIENVGTEPLSDVWVGFCWDFNIARLAGGSYGSDDLVSYDEKGEISYMYDDDGDGGLSPGYIGGAFLNAPLAGHGWYTEAQEPLSDRARYALLSGGVMEDPKVPGNYRLVHSVGPFDLPVGRKVPLIYALAIGEGLSALQNSVNEAAVAVQRDVIATADSTISADELHEIPVIVGEDKRALGRLQWAVDWEFCDVGLTVVDPQGTEITPEMAVFNPLISYIVEPHRKAYEIIDPMPGPWTLRIRYLEGPGPFPYRYAATVFGLPWGFGPPLESFQVDQAHIRFPHSRDGLPGPSNFTCQGYLDLGSEGSFHPESDAIVFRMGPYQETIPPGSFATLGDGNCYWLYKLGAGVWGLCLVILDLENGQFYVSGRGVDMRDTQNPVLVRMAIGPLTGFEEILMEESPNLWIYPPQ
jgi:hypothetical protein